MLRDVAQILGVGVGIVIGTAILLYWRSIANFVQWRIEQRRRLTAEFAIPVNQCQRCGVYGVTDAHLARCPLLDDVTGGNWT